jgi:hypothetical protein
MNGAAIACCGNCRRSSSLNGTGELGTPGLNWISHRRIDMKSLFATAGGVAALLATGGASAQSGPMMNGGHWGGGWMGGYGGVWVPVLLVVVVGLVAWIVMQKRK